MPTLTQFQFDMRRLAVGCLYLNLGRAAPEFPTTCRSHPSYKVLVGLVPPGGQSAYEELFPFFVSWDLWRNVVVPLFVDGSKLVKVVKEKSPSLRRPANEIRLSQDLEGLLLDIEAVLLESLEEGGYVPPATRVEDYVADDGPLVYKTETEMEAETAAAADSALAESVWEDEVATADYLARLGLMVPIVVPNPVSLDEPVECLGTDSLVYEQFDL